MNTVQGNNVRLVEGVPKESDFASRSGTPLIIDSLTGIGYFMAGDYILALQGGPVNVVNAFSNGFDAGYS